MLGFGVGAAIGYAASHFVGRTVALTLAGGFVGAVLGFILLVVVKKRPLTFTVEGDSMHGFPGLPSVATGSGAIAVSISNRSVAQDGASGSKLVEVSHVRFSSDDVEAVLAKECGDTIDALAFAREIARHGGYEVRCNFADGTSETLTAAEVAEGRRVSLLGDLPLSRTSDS